ncbi:MAG: CBS domain-containing protein [Acidimicrobiia bacterium]
MAAPPEGGGCPSRDICSHRLVSVSPDDPTERAVEVMRSESIRRVAVMEGAEIVGIVSLGDLAIERDPRSASPT